jgi:hypothetical protein
VQTELKPGTKVYMTDIDGGILCSLEGLTWYEQIKGKSKRSRKPKQRKNRK